MVTIRIIKEWNMLLKTGNIKFNVGDIVDSFGKKDADSLVEEGFAEYIKEETKQPQKIDEYALQITKEENAGKFIIDTQYYIYIRYQYIQIYSIEPNLVNELIHVEKARVEFTRTAKGYYGADEESFKRLSKKLVDLKIFDSKKDADSFVAQKQLSIQNIQKKLDLEYLEETCVVKEVIRRERKKPQIDLPKEGINISKFAEDLANCIYVSNELFYRSSEKAIVRIGYRPIRNENTNKEEELLSFIEITPSCFVTFAENFADIGMSRWNKRTRDYDFEIKSMNVQQAKIVLDSDQFIHKMPLIDLMFTVPLPRIFENKLTYPTKGYNKNLYSFLSYDSPEIDENITLEKAKETIDLIFSEFCFKCEQDRVNAIAALLTPFLRCLYPSYTCRTPIFFYKANRERAGKDYCANITKELYKEAPDDTPICNGKETNDEEFRKKVMGKFIFGFNRLHLANNKGYLNSAQLEALSTNKVFSDRILGRNEVLVFNNTLEISLSANTGITYTPDLANRCVFINLFLSIEEPNDRDFRLNPHDYVKNNRNLIISSLYCFVKHWFNNGMKKGSVPFASFPEWAAICGGIMECVGYLNPCNKNDEKISYGGDSETRDIKRLWELCNEKWDNKWVKKKEIMDAIANEDEFNLLFTWLNLKENPDRMKFSKMFDKYEMRQFSNINCEVMENERASRKEYRFVKFSQNCQQVLKNGNFGNFGSFQTTENTKKIKIVSELEGIHKLPRLPDSVSSLDVKNYKHRNELIKFIVDNDTGDGVPFEKITDGNDEIVNQWLKDLCDEGTLYQPHPGIYKVLQ